MGTAIYTRLKPIKPILLDIFRKHDKMDIVLKSNKWRIIKIMKKLTAIVFSLVLSLSLAACGTKNDSTAKEGQTEQQTGEKGQDTNTEGGTLIVGTEAGFAPYEYMEGDKIVGVDMDIAEAIAVSMGKTLEIKNMDFDGALAAVQSGKIDMVAAGVSITEEREKVMDFSAKYVDSTDVIVVNKQSPAVSSAEELEGKTIGVQQGNVADNWVSDPENVKDATIKRYTKFVQAAEDLKNNKIDAIVMDVYPAEELVAANEELVIVKEDNSKEDSSYVEVFSDSYAIAVKKGNTELLEKINAVIEELQSSKEMEQIIARHVTATADQKETKSQEEMKSEEE